MSGHRIVRKVVVKLPRARHKGTLRTADVQLHSFIRHQMKWPTLHTEMGKSSQVPTLWKAGRAPQPFLIFEKTQNLWFLQGIEPRIGQPIVYSLYRMGYRTILRVYMHKTAVSHLWLSSHWWSSRNIYCCSFNWIQCIAVNGKAIMNANYETVREARESNPDSGNGRCRADSYTRVYREITISQWLIKMSFYHFPRPCRGVPDNKDKQAFGLINLVPTRQLAAK